MISNIGCRAKNSDLLCHFGGLGFLNSNRSSNVFEDLKQPELVLDR